jgi:hypothetical protein
MQTQYRFLLGVWLCGCGSSAAPAAKTDDGIAISAECRGFPMEGIRYSPGGTVLPNKCKPFDATTNNPYAVRCVDVVADYETRYPGDEFCILPPPPELGAQVGIHPQGADYWQAMWSHDYSAYSDDAMTGSFELGPGGEIEQTYRSNLGNADAHSYFRIDSRMRTGSHHMATYRTSQPGDEGWGAISGPDKFVPDGAGPTFWNSQRPNTDRPQGSLAIPSEDAGLGMPIDAEQAILLDVHHFNTSDAPILREAWINVWWVEGTVEQAVVEQPVVAPVSVPPGELTDLDGVFSPTADTRVLSLFGHRHAWTRRLNAWVHRGDGTDEPVYDSFDWLDVPTFSYDSLSANPTANPDTRTDGASSGILVLHAGDALHFTCHVDTTPAHASELGVAVPDHVLTFGNRAFEAEMCILYAQTTPAL